MRIIHYTHPSARSASPANGYGNPYARVGAENEIDWLFGTALTGFAGPARGPQFPIDLYEDKQNTYVRAELPGVTRDAIGVEIVDGSLSIEATRKVKSGEAENTQTFSRLVSISDEVQTDKVSASYENGVLTVTLPRKEEAKPKKITVPVS
jgi:HSP20 family protein